MYSCIYAQIFLSQQNNIPPLHAYAGMTSIFSYLRENIKHFTKREEAVSASGNNALALIYGGEHLAAWSSTCSAGWG